MDDFGARIRSRFSRWEWKQSGAIGLNALAVLGSVASVVGLFLGAGGAMAIRDVFIGCVALSGLVSLWLGAWLYKASIRRSRYAEAFFYAHHVIHYLRNELAQIELHDLKSEALQERAQRAVQLVLDAVSRAFIVVTGANCRACIKVLQEPSMLDGQSITREQMCEFGEVRCFSRDSVSAAHMTPDDDTPSRLNRNPRFSDLFTDETLRFYHGADCNDQKKHHTDSHEKYPHGLPYQSELVWPIRLPSSVYPQSQGERPKQKLVGYLIVDCRRKNAFEERVDFEIGALFADALYGFLDKCHVRYYGYSPNKDRVPASNGSQAVPVKG
ncbi:MAG TPA: hypothetical protein VG826_11710 [Pirellulales bacterium]|nr:hypothetical protein [Pirellulales bacterium]